jgi:SSS family solute:Na+ symporter
MLSAYFTIDYIILYIFLSIILLIGIRSGRNIKDIRDYALANRIYGSGVLAMTILATYITGNKGIGYVGYVFDDGILPVFSILICGAIITFWFIAEFVAPQMVYFKDCFTLPEMMGKMYGPRIRIIVSILGIIYSIAIVALQIIWFAYIGDLLAIKPVISITLGSLLIIVYATHGGIKSVTTTDVVQFIGIVLLVPLVAFVVVYKVGGFKSLISQLPSSVFDVVNHPSRNDYIVYSIWDLFPAFPLSFPFVQRMLMAKNTKQLKNSSYLTLSVLTIFYLLLTVIGLGAIVLKIQGDIYVPVKGSQIYIYIVKKYLPLGLKGLMVVGFIAGVMSTADSFLHSAGLSLAYDLIQPSFKRRYNVSDLKLTKYATIILGMLALAFAIYYKVLPREQYQGKLDLGKGLSFITDLVGLSFTIPFLAGVMGLKPCKRAFYVSAILTSITFTFSEFIIPYSLVIPVSSLCAIMSFFITHYLHHNGFVIMQREKRQVYSKSIIPIFVNLIPTPKKIINYSREKVAKYGADPTTFSFFIAFTYMVPFVMESYGKQEYYGLLLGLRGVAVILCIILIMREFWPNWLKRNFAIFWHFTLMYCLPFITTVLFLIEQLSFNWLINVSLVIILLIVLVDWVTFFILSIVGVISGIIFYKLCVGQIVSINGNIAYNLIYASLFTTIIGLLFARRREKTVDDKLKISTTVATATGHEVVDDLLEAHAAAQLVDMKRMQGAFHTATIGDKQGYFIDKELYDSIIKVYPAVHEAASRIKITTLMFRDAVNGPGILLEQEKLSMKEVMNEALKSLYLVERRKNKLQLDLTADFEFMGSRRMFKHVIWNLLKNAYKHSGTEEVFIWLESDSKKEYNEVHIKDNGIGINAEHLDKIFELFFTTGSRENSTGIGLSLCKTIIEKLGGNIRCESKQGEGSYTEFIISLPKI